MRPSLCRLGDDFHGPLLLIDRRQEKVDHAGSQACLNVPPALPVKGERRTGLAMERLAEIKAHDGDHGSGTEHVLRRVERAHHAAGFLVGGLDDAAVGGRGIGLDVVDSTQKHLARDLVALRRILEGAGKRNRVVSFGAAQAENRTAAALPVVSIAPSTTPVTEGTAAAFVLSRTGATDAVLNLEAAQADVTRVRFALEGSRPFGLGGDALLTPTRRESSDGGAEQPREWPLDPISEGDMEVARVPSHAERGR